MTPASAKTTALVMLVMTVEVFRADNGTDDDDSSKWIPLCTLTSEGSSRHSVSMPCGVRLESESHAIVGDDESSGNYIRVDIKDVRGGSETWHNSGKMQYYGEKTQDDDGKMRDDDHKTQDDGRKMQDDGGKSQDDDDKGPGGTLTIDEDGNAIRQGQNVDSHLEEITGSETENQYEVEVVDEYREDEVAGDDDEKYSEDDVTVEVDDYDVGGNSKREEQIVPMPIKTVMISYLQDAKEQLYSNIHYLLNLLQQAFFNARLDRRSGRDSMNRRILNAEGRQVENKKQQTIASAILKPTFERSMMTMSFLMFGVFVIQVVQRIMQTLQQSSEMMSMGNPAQGNPPTASASIF